MPRFAFAAATIAALLVPALAFAEPEPEKRPPERFGHRGQVVLSDSFQLGFGSTHFSGSSQASRTSVWVDPGIDYFVADNLSLGAAVAISYADDTVYYGQSLQSRKTLGVSGGVRAAVNWPLDGIVSFYPRMTLWYGISQTRWKVVSSTDATTTPFGTDSNDDHFALYLYAPILVHPVPHLFLGLGPTLYTELTHGSDNPNADGIKATTWGLASMIGGWF